MARGVRFWDIVRNNPNGTSHVSAFEIFGNQYSAGPNPAWVVDSFGGLSYFRNNSTGNPNVVNCGGAALPANANRCTADYLIRSLNTNDTNQTWSGIGVRRDNSTRGIEARIINGGGGPPSTTLSLQVVHRHTSGTTNIGPSVVIPAPEAVAGATGMISIAVTNTSGNLWAVESWFTRANGDYLTPAGGWTNVVTAWLATAYDATAQPLPSPGLAGPASWNYASATTGIWFRNIRTSDIGTVAPLLEGLDNDGSGTINLSSSMVLWGSGATVVQDLYMSSTPGVLGAIVDSKTGSDAKTWAIAVPDKLPRYFTVRATSPTGLAPLTDDSNQVMSRVFETKATVLAIGDSLTDATPGWRFTFEEELRFSNGPRIATFLEAGVSGARVEDYLAGSGNMNAALAMATASAGAGNPVTHAIIMLGTNNSPSAASFQTSLNNIISTLTGAGITKILLHSSPLTSQAALLVGVQSYQAILAATAAANPGVVYWQNPDSLQGYDATGAFFWQRITVPDSRHPSAEGYRAIGYGVWEAFDKSFYTASSGGGGGSTIGGYIPVDMAAARKPIAAGDNLSQYGLQCGIICKTAGNLVGTDTMGNVVTVAMTPGQIEFTHFLKIDIATTGTYDLRLPMYPQ